MTGPQVAWAADHDWFRGTEYVGNICGVWVREDGCYAFFVSFAELREWAGY